MLVPSIDRCFPLTAAGPAALSTFRFAGAGVDHFISRRLSRQPKPARPTHLELRDDRGLIDDPVAVLREDGLALDLTTHGGATIANAVRALAEADGFTWTVPGDQPWDDVALIGSVDATSIFDHEFQLALPFARTERAMRMLLAQPQAWAGVDVPDAQMLADRSLEYLLTPPTLAIVGLPNAGKSTLANQLFGQRRSIVSPLAGTTRDWVGELADLDGLIVTLLDTPGLRQTADAIEQQAIEQSQTPIRSADRVLLLLDATRDDAEQAALLGAFPNSIRCVNKLDARLAGWDDERVRSLDAVGVIASTGVGIDTLIRRVHDAFDIGGRPQTAPRVWTRRQRSMSTSS